MPTPDFAAAVALVTTCGAGLLAYAVSSRVTGPADFDRVRTQGGSIFLGIPVMNAGYWLLQPLVRACVRAGISPAALSWSTLIPAGAAAGAAAYAQWGLAAWGLLLSALLDVLDGAVARAANQTSAAGAVLDSVLDRYAEFIFFAGLLAHFRAQLILQLVCFAAVAGSILVTYSTAKAEALHATPPRGWMKRSDRLACLIIGTLLSALLPEPTVPGWQPLPLIIAISLIAVLANLSAVLRFRALAREVQP